MSQNISPLSPRDESRSSKTVTSLVGLVTKPTPALSAIYRKDRMRIPLQSRTLYRELGETGPESGDTAPQTLHVCSFFSSSSEQDGLHSSEGSASTAARRWPRGIWRVTA